MDAQQLITIFNTVFENDPVLLENSLTRLKLQSELSQIESQITVAQTEASAEASANVVAIDALIALRVAKQAEIDALEA